MTNRERILAVFRGEKVDRFPVWLKMANRTWQNSQPEPYRSMSEPELLRAAGCDLMRGCRVPVSAEHTRVSVHEAREDHTRRTTIKTPDGDLVGLESSDAVTQAWPPVSYMVHAADDLRRLRWLFTDVKFSADPARVADARAKLKELVAADAVTIQGCGPSPLMNLVEHYAGPQNTVFLMTDEPGLFAETIALMHRSRMEFLAVLAANCTADTLWLTENTCTGLISPKMFQHYVMPCLRDYGKLILEHGIVAVHHMCGKLNALLELIDRLPAPVNEAYTTRPLGNVSLAEGRRRMPSKALVGGTNATLWLEPVEKIVATVAADLGECPDRRRIFLTSAGVLSPLVSFEKARQVVEAFKRL
jgi:uroporphyrinogen-III decarboxylase